jgi:hypothetical protein
MSKGRPEQQIVIRSVRRDPPDLAKLGRALIQLAIAKAEAEAKDETRAGAVAETNRERGTLVLN